MRILFWACADKMFFDFLAILLCRDYAEAKDCVTQQAKTGCAIGQYINRDLFNPFCTYNTDPPLNSSGTAFNCFCFLTVTPCKRLPKIEIQLERIFDIQIEIFQYYTLFN